MPEDDRAGTRDAFEVLEPAGGDVLSPPGADESVSALPDVPSLVTTPEGVVTRVSEPLAELVGVDSCELIGIRLEELFGGDRGRNRRLRTKNGPIDVSLVGWRRPGTEAIVHLLADASEQPAVEEIVDEQAVVPTDAEPDEERKLLIEAQRMARIGSFVFDPATGKLRHSPVLRELFLDGRANEAFGSLDEFISVVHPEDRADAERFYADLMSKADGRQVGMGIRNLRGDRVYLCIARAEPTGEGTPQLVGTVQDVTTQRQLEHQLREERRRLRDAQRVAGLGTWEQDPATGETVMSETLCEITGWDTDKTRTTYDEFLRHVPLEDRDRVNAVWHRLYIERAPVELEHRFVRPDGAVRLLRIHAAEVRDLGGSPRVVGTVQDVTDQRAASTRLRRFTDLYKLAPVGIGVFDEHERLLDANDALCELLKYTPTELRGKKAAELNHSDDRAEALVPTGSVAGNAHTIPQRRLIRSDGMSVHCELHIAASVQDDGSKSWLVVFEDITERIRHAEDLRHQATHDDLTGLPNRLKVHTILADLLSKENSERVALLFCDIDNFKRINDSLGHDAGDDLLLSVARRLETRLPEGCMAARLSGDEFVIICSDVELAGGLHVLTTTVSTLLRTAVPVQGHMVRMSASIGVAMPTAPDTNGADLLRFADTAMFDAKRRGSDRVSFASPALIASAEGQMQLESELRDALARNELTLNYQPIVSADGRVLAAEALVRWPHPERGLLAPDTILPVAEQGDMMGELDRWVLTTALDQAVEWPTPDGRPVSVAVNLGGLMQADPMFVDQAADIIGNSGIARDRVALELVETSLVDLPSPLRRAMSELADSGVRFAVDDFGTGYSSLARLRDLPAQIIKVDRKFVSGVGSDRSDLAVARAIVDMARAMGRDTVAEGVETAAQFHVLRGLGVDSYQGFLFSHPVTTGELREILEKGTLPIPDFD